jgi:hypothetical protein
VRRADGTRPVKQRGGLTAATETLSQFDLAAAVPCLPWSGAACNGDSQTFDKPAS